MISLCAPLEDVVYVDHLVAIGRVAVEQIVDLGYDLGQTHQHGRKCHSRTRFLVQAQGAPVPPQSGLKVV